MRPRRQHVEEVQEGHGDVCATRSLGRGRARAARDPLHRGGEPGGLARRPEAAASNPGEVEGAGAHRSRPGRGGYLGKRSGTGAGST